MAKSAYDFPQVYERAGVSQPGDLGCIMLDLEPIPVSSMLHGVRYFYGDDRMRYAQGPVADETAHATLLYGLTPDEDVGVRQRESVDELLADLDLTSVTVDHVSSFPGMFGLPYACVIGKLATDGDLGEANRRLRFLPHIDTFVTYTPHVTLAYVHDADAADAIATLSRDLDGRRLAATGINYGGGM